MWYLQHITFTKTNILADFQISMVYLYGSALSGDICSEYCVVNLLNTSFSYDMILIEAPLLLIILWKNLFEKRHIQTTNIAVK